VPWGGLVRASLLSYLGHGNAGFWGQKDTGVNGVLTRDETWRGTAPRCLATVTPLL
jgi:hypothetical protein